MKVTKLLTQLLRGVSIKGEVTLLHENLGVLIGMRSIDVQHVSRACLNIRGNTMFRHLRL